MTKSGWPNVTTSRMHMVKSVLAVLAFKMIDGDDQTREFEEFRDMENSI